MERELESDLGRHLRRVSGGFLGNMHLRKPERAVCSVRTVILNESLKADLIPIPNLFNLFILHDCHGVYCLFHTHTHSRPVIKKLSSHLIMLLNLGLVLSIFLSPCCFSTLTITPVESEQCEDRIVEKE